MDTAEIVVKSGPQIAAERAIALLGGPAQAARVLNVKDHRHQTIQSWLKNRIPAEYCPAIERETRLLDPSNPVICEQLRPDIPWGVLRLQSSDSASAHQE